MYIREVCLLEGLQGPVNTARINMGVCMCIYTLRPEEAFGVPLPSQPYSHEALFHELGAKLVLSKP